MADHLLELRRRTILDEGVSRSRSRRPPLRERRALVLGSPGQGADVAPIAHELGATESADSKGSPSNRPGASPSPSPGPAGGARSTRRAARA